MKTANKCFQARAEDVQRRWYVVDATDKVLGRLAVRIANVLMGKNKPTYTPHVDCGDYVIVLNCDKVRVTGTKLDDVVYQDYTGYPSGLRERTMRQQLARRPQRVLFDAVRRMMPKNALAKHMLLKLKLYTQDSHPHQAQMPEPLPRA